MTRNCLDCVRKHFGQAYVLLNEYADDPEFFEEHFWYAMGHLGEASDESKGLALSTIIRAHRRRMEEDEEYWIDFKPLIRLATRYAYQEIGVETDPDEFKALLEEVQLPVKDFLFGCCDDIVISSLPPKTKTKKKKKKKKKNK